MPIYVNGISVNTFKFSGGELHLNVNSIQVSHAVNILAHLHHSDDIMCLLLLVDALKRAYGDIKINLEIPYFPYARQDRVCNEGEPLSIKVMTNLINTLACNKVTVYDPHSEVTPALLNNCEIVSLGNILIKTELAQFIISKNLTLVSPDAGAEKKVRLAAKMLGNNRHKLEVLSASKVRDTYTGNILSAQLNGECKNKNLIILDDICDGGRTFIELAEILKEKSANDIYLYVTHGIFSKGLCPLAPYFKHIYCYHYMGNPIDINSKLLTILEPKINI